MQSLRFDVRNAYRALRGSPGATLLAVLVLGLAIGANSSMFSLVNTLLLKPRPIPEPERLVMVLRHDQGEHNYDSASWPEYQDLRRGVATFDALAAQMMGMVGIGEGADARRGFVSLISENYFEAFGVAPRLGRAFTEEEARPDALQPVAILSHQAWQRRGGTDDVVGRTIVVNGTRTTVVGVAPRGFSGLSTLISPELYMPLGMATRIGESLDGERPSLSLRDNQALLLFGRLREGTSRTAADADLARVSSALEERYPATSAEVVYETHEPSRISISTSPQQDDELLVLAGLLLAMALIVLFVAGFNLAALQDARNLRRRREIGIRLALGSGRVRLIRQLVAEAVLLGLGGAAVGLAIATVAPGLVAASLARLAPFDIHLSGELDWRIVGATLGFALLASLVVGLFPAVRASRPDLVADLKEGGDDSGRLRRRFGISRGDLPVMLQLALSTVLLVCAGLFVLSAVRGANVDPGFDVQRQVVLEIDPSLAGYESERTRALQTRLRDRLEQVPGVRSAAFASTVPFGMVNFGVSVVDADEPVPEDGRRRGQGAALNTVSSAYFETLDLPVLDGREFRDTEARPVVMMDEVLARRLFGEETAVGRRIRFDDSERLQTEAEVVGVVANTRDSLFDREERAHVYLPASRHDFLNTQVHIATEREPDAAALSSIRSAVREVDPSLPILALRSFSAHLDANFEVWALRTGGQLFSAFALLALALAMAGVYGVQAYRVARRTKEIGLRMALGATLRDTVRLVLHDGFRVALVGTTLGVLLAAAAARVLATFTVEVSPLDPGILGGSWLLLLVVALAACALPARRAARLDPLDALRDE